MRIKVKLFSLTEPASDGSMIPRNVVEEYLSSDRYKKAIADHTMLGTATHRVRSIATGAKDLNPGIAKTIGKDDLLLTLGQGTAPTHYIEKLEINDLDNWVYAWAQLLPDTLDTEGNELLKRLKTLLRSGVRLGVSAVILGYWDSKGGGFGQKSGDVLVKLVNLRAFDFTMNGSWKDAKTVEIYDDDGERIDDATKMFSDHSADTQEVKVKMFSDPSSFSDVKSLGLPKTSKIDGAFTKLQAKVFSNVADIKAENEEEKTFSVATLKERIRYNDPKKFSPRMRLRRLFLDYKQLVKQMGGAEKIDPETLKTMKSLFVSDLNMLVGNITKDVKNGKQISTLLGCGSLGVVPRKAAQELQIPYRLAFIELEKTGKISPMRFQKIKDAYNKFIKAMTDEVFGSNPIPEGLEEQANKEEGNA